jgi:MFS family permease
VLDTVTDRHLIDTTAFLRALTTGLFGVLGGVYLARLALSPRAIGSIIAAGRAGATTAARLATLAADRIGRRRFLLGLATLSVVGMLVFALASAPVLLGAAAFVGMLNRMGRDRGAAIVLEQAALLSTAIDEERTRVVAVYSMLQDLGHAVGALLVRVPAVVGAARGGGVLEQPRDDDADRRSDRDAPRPAVRAAHAQDPPGLEQRLVPVLLRRDVDDRRRRSRAS